MNHTVLCIIFKTWHSPFMWGIVGNYIYIIYIFIGVNGNEGFVIPHWSTPPEPLQLFKLHPLVSLQLFKLHPLVSYKFKPPLPHIYSTHIFVHLKKSNIAFSFLLSNSSSRVIHSALCVRNLPAFEVPLHL